MQDTGKAFWGSMKNLTIEEDKKPVISNGMAPKSLFINPGQPQENFQKIKTKKGPPKPEKWITAKNERKEENKSEVDDDGDTVSISSDELLSSKQSHCTSNRSYSKSSDSGFHSQMEAAGGEKKKGTKGKFKCTATFKEDHGAALYGIAVDQFGTKNEPDATLFATVGANRVTIYKSLRNGDVRLVKCFEDPDKMENFYTCAWGYDEVNNRPILAAAGVSGTIRLICPKQQIVYRTFQGHLGAINHLMFHPTIPELLLSASKDHSLKLFNVKSDNTVAIFSGSEGHLDEVLSCDINLEATWMMSGSMDHSIKIWCMANEAINQKIDMSRNYDVVKTGKAFSTLHVTCPLFTTRAPEHIHNNYVDCVKFFRDFILSKSCENSIVMWEPDKDIYIKTPHKRKPLTAFSLHDCKFPITNSTVWFIRFAMDIGQTTLAIGNVPGKIYVWNVDVDYDRQIKPTILSHPLCNNTIRQTALSFDGNLLICVCDDGTIWHWEKQHNKED